MRVDDPNLREQVVFVGGSVAGLPVTDPLADPVRATRDVDAVVNATRATFHRIEEAVAQLQTFRSLTSPGRQDQRNPGKSVENTKQT